MSQTPLKIGLIGLGKMGQNHLRVLSMLKSVSLQFIYDVHSETLNLLSKQYDTPASTNLTESLKNVDAVVICSPTSTHYDYVLQVSDYVKNIFVEKPLTDTLESTAKISELAKQKKLNIQVGFIERFNPAVQALSTILKQGQEVINLDLTRTNKLSSRITDVDIITDLMIHDIDLALHFNGPVQSVVANGVIENGSISFANAILHHDNNTFSRILASKMTEKKIRLIQATCHECFIDCELLKKEIIVHKQSTIKQKDGSPYIISAIEETIEVPPQEALLTELQAFIGYSNGENISIPGIESSLEAAKVCQQIQQAIQTP